MRPPSLDAKTIFLRVGRNIGFLFGSTGIVLGLGIVQVGLNARALGPEGMGVLTLVQSYALLLSYFFSFESWQPLIKFGAEAIAEDDRKRLRDLVLLAALFDLAGVTMSGIAGFAILFWFGPLLGIEPASLGLAAIFAATLFFRVGGATTGVLRLFDRFSVLAGLNIANALLGLAAMIVLFAVGGSLLDYVVSLAALNVLASLMLIVASFMIYRRQGLPPLHDAEWTALRLYMPSFIRFSLATFPLSSVNALRMQMDVFLLGWLVGPSAVGLYSIAQRVSSAAARMTAPVEQVVYPEIAVLCTDKAYTRLRHILVRFFGFGVVAAAGCVVMILLLGPFIVALVAGPGFGEAVTPLNWLMISVAITCAGFWIRPAIVCSMGPARYLFSMIAAGVASAVTAAVAIQQLGVAGAGTSQIVFAVVWFAMNTTALLVHFKGQTDGEPPAES